MGRLSNYTSREGREGRRGQESRAQGQVGTHTYERTKEREQRESQLGLASQQHGHSSLPLPALEGAACEHGTPQWRQH